MSEDRAKFEAWNFAEAQDAIAKFLKHPPKEFPKSERNFLGKLLEMFAHVENTISTGLKIDKQDIALIRQFITQNQSKSSTEKLFISELNDVLLKNSDTKDAKSEKKETYDVQTALHKAIDTYKRGVIFTKFYALHILEMLQIRIKETHHLDLPQYHALLSKIMGCILGVINDTHDNRYGVVEQIIPSNVEVKDQKSELKQNSKWEQVEKFFCLDSNLIYAYAHLLGAAVQPYNQSFDPLIGMQVGTLEEKFKPIEGLCGGHVKADAKKIAKTGKGVKFFGLDTEIYLLHKEIKMDYIKNYERCQNNIIDVIPIILETIEMKGIYSLIQYWSPEKDGHAIQLRMIPQTDLIEIYDPNYGRFLFEDKKSASLWLTILITHSYSKPSFCNLHLSKLGDQSITAKPTMGYNSQGVNNDDLKLFVSNDLKNVLTFFYNELLNKPDHFLETVKNLNHLLINHYKAMLSYLNDENILKDQASIISKISEIIIQWFQNNKSNESGVKELTELLALRDSLLSSFISESLQQWKNTKPGGPS